MKLLLVDGSNLVMRAAFGGEVPPERAAPIAAGLVHRVARLAHATHLIVAMDSPTLSWRKQEYPDYKANRTTDTTPWLRAAYEEFCRAGWYVEETSGYEADDIIATLARRTQGRAAVCVCSSDSDLLCLTDHAEFLKPADGGKFLPITAADVCAKYQVAAVTLLPQLKALMGESGDNVPGVPGIGKVRAAQLLQTYGNLEGILAAGAAGKCKPSALVAAHAATVQRALRLVTLSLDAPLLAIKPSSCRYETH